MISNPLTDISNCVIWLDAADTSTLGTTTTGPGVIGNGDFIRYWKNKANPSKSFTQSISNKPPTYYANLSAVNFENAFTDPYLRYSAGPGDEFVFDKQITVIMLCSVGSQSHSNSSKTMLELSAAYINANDTSNLSIYTPLRVSGNVVGWTGADDTFGATVGSGLNMNPFSLPGTMFNYAQYAHVNAGALGIDLSQNISDAYMFTSRLSDYSFCNFSGLTRSETISADGVLLNLGAFAGSPRGILKSVQTSIGYFIGAVYEVLIYDKALSFDELTDIQNYFYRKWTPIGVKIKRDVYPKSSGNWNSVNWSINSEPFPWNQITPTDSICTNNGYSVNIDTNIHVRKITNNRNISDIENPILQTIGNAGTFNITNNVSITADFVGVGSGHYFITISPTVSAVINGSFYGGGSLVRVPIYKTASNSFIHSTELRNYLVARSLIDPSDSTATNNVTYSDIGGSRVGAIGLNRTFILSAEDQSSLTVNGNITSTVGPNRLYMGGPYQGYRAIQWNSTSPLFINGDIIMRGVVGNSNAPGGLNRCWHVVSSGPIYMKGDIYPSRVQKQIDANYNYGIESTNVVYLTGNVYGGPNGGHSYIGIYNRGGELYIEGDLIVDNGLPTTGDNINNAVYCDGNSKTYIKGNVLGPRIESGNNIYALNLRGTSYAYVLGNVEGGGGAVDCGGIRVQDTASVEVSGDVLPIVGPAIYSTSTTPISVYLINDGLNYSGGEYSVPPILAKKMFISESSDINKKFTKFQKDEGNGKDFTFYLTDSLTFSYPLSEHVRYGLTYGPSYSLSGAMHIPETSAVAWNVPVNTDVRITELKAGERYEIITVDPFVPFTNFGAKSNTPGLTFTATGPSTRGGLGIARQTGKSVVTTVDIMRENVSNMNPGTHNNPMLRTFLENSITEFETISAIAKSFNYL